MLVNNFNLYLDNLVDQGYDIILIKYYFEWFYLYGNEYNLAYGYGCGYNYGCGSISGYGHGSGYVLGLINGYGSAYMYGYGDGAGD